MTMPQRDEYFAACEHDHYCFKFASHLSRMVRSYYKIPNDIEPRIISLCQFELYQTIFDRAISLTCIHTYTHALYIPIPSRLSVPLTDPRAQAVVLGPQHSALPGARAGVGHTIRGCGRRAKPPHQPDSGSIRKTLLRCEGGVPSFVHAPRMDPGAGPALDAATATYA